jgi:hypothetical protein
MFFSLFALLLVFIQHGSVCARTQADNHRTHVADIRLLKGTVKVQIILCLTSLIQIHNILGAFLGKVEYVQDALAHANTGNVNAIMTREIGEHFLKLGKAGVDFPVAPALHIAIRLSCYLFH